MIRSRDLFTTARFVIDHCDVAWSAVDEEAAYRAEGAAGAA